MDRQPVLQGELLSLRPLAADDWEALYAVASDPAIWEQHPIDDRWREDVFRGFFDEALADGGALVAVDRARGAIVGSSQFRDVRAEDGGSMEIGWTFLARSHWGGRYNVEMKRLMLGHAFDHVAAVRFRVGETNMRSRIAVERLGARLTDEVERASYRGKEVVHVTYVLGRDRFNRDRQP